MPRLVGWALTGQDLGESGEPGAARGAGEVVTWLAARGWGAERLAAHRASRQEARAVWPHPVPPELVESWSQFHSLLAMVRREVGVDGLTPARHEGPRVIGPGERRLLVERPPHHG